MIEVFKTDVQNLRQANMLRFELGKVFTDYQITFDLNDCDKILRIKGPNGISIQAYLVIDLMKNFGFTAEVLPDIVVVADTVNI